jgi:hypothetical protein
MSRKIKIDKSMPKRRNPMATLAKMRRVSVFDHKTEPRGGATNEFADLMAELDEYKGWDQTDDDDDFDWE